MKIKLSSIAVDDRKSTLERNESSRAKFAFSNRKTYEKGYDTLTLTGEGAFALDRYLGEEGLAELLEKRIHDDFVINRYNLEKNATLQDLLDTAEVFSCVQTGVTVALNGHKFHFPVKLIKQGNETKDTLAEFFVPRF